MVMDPKKPSKISRGTKPSKSIMNGPQEQEQYIIKFWQTDKVCVSGKE